MAHETASNVLGSRLLTIRRFTAVCAAFLIAVTTSSSAQTPAGQTPADAAARLMNLGQYDEVETLLASATDGASIVMRARAHMARGRNAEAEKLLTAVATGAPGSDAALELGLMQIRLGRLDQGARLLQGVLTRSAQTSGQDLARVGRAARALGYFEDANGFFRRAVRAAPDDPAIHTEWGELFLEKYNPEEAAVSFDDAMKASADYIPALVGLARATAIGNPPGAREIAEKALAINPNYVPAHLLIAELSLDDRRRDQAREAIANALRVNPSSLEARSLNAASAALEDRTADFEAIVAEVLKMHPTYGEVYRVAGDQLGRGYRFDEAAEMTRRAIQLDPSNIRAHSDLGMHLLRIGDEAGARRSLETAFKADPYNVMTHSLLTNLDLVDTFVTVRDADLIVKMHPEEAPVMREFLLPLARQALDTLAKQYEFTPRTPILVEMFSEHDDFAVRTLGMPGFVGALGACFGRVVTLDSPRARPPGQFNWATTLWHEMAHVITLQMSGNRLPRWLSEGISVYEERRARADWGREMEVSFAQAIATGKVLKLRDLNDGFTDPEFISLAYYEASLVVELLVDNYGEPALRRFITSYGRGLSTEDAMKQAFNADIDQIQVAFDAKLRRDFANTLRAMQAPELPENATVERLKELAAANPDSFIVHLDLGQALHEAGDRAGAIAAFERAATLVPGARGDQNPNAYIALIAGEAGDTARAIQALEAVIKVDSSDVESARKLGLLLTAQGETARAAAVWTLVAELDPFDASAQAIVGRSLLQRGDAPAAVRTLRASVAGGIPDKANVLTDLAEAHLRVGELAQARQQIVAALEIAPSFERAQDLLLKIIEAQ